MFKLFNIFKRKKEKLMTEEEYYNYLISDDNNKNLYGFDKKYSNQEEYLYTLYGNCNSYNKRIKLIVISDTHNCLLEEEFRTFINKYNDYDACILLGDHSSSDISLILRYIDKNKVYGILGNHDYNYLSEYNIPNLNGKIININGTTILGIEGSFKYKPSSFPSFTQKNSISFLNDMPSVDILVSHDNRFNSSMELNPSHQGLFGITYYLFKKKISYHIHGHIHESYRKELINKTKEISIHKYEYIEL